MNVHGFELLGDWQPANRGYTATATKGGKKYFLKKYGDFKLPRDDGKITPAGKARMIREFDEFKDNRIRINLALKELAGPGGNIILPLEWFVDDIYYVEATEWVENLIEDSEIMKLPADELKFVMLTAAGALNNVHRKGIVHSDLKRTNLLAARNSSGRAVGKIIDFDKSYFTDNIREDELGGDQPYLSPELAYAMLTDFSEPALALLSTKSDIFSLGVVFHNYLTGGDFPELVNLTGALEERAKEGKAVYCCEALLAEANLKVSPKIKEEYLVNLLCAMLQPEPEDRPTALEVVEALRDKKVIPLKDGSRVTPASGATASAKTATATPAKPTSTASTAKATTAVPTGFCAAWPEHPIKLNEDKLRASGYVAAEQVIQGTNKGYKLYKADGTSKVMLPSVLKLTGLASAAPAAAAAPAATTATSAGEIEDDGTLWPEDAGYEFNLAAVTAAGYTTAAKATKNGKQGYALVKASGEQKFLTFSNMKLMGFVKKV